MVFPQDQKVQKATAAPKTGRAKGEVVPFKPASPHPLLLLIVCALTLCNAEKVQKDGNGAELQKED